VNRTVLPHDLHVLVAGFRRVPDSLYLLEGKEYQAVARIQPGMGGEGGIYATVTAQHASHWGEENVIRGVLQERISSAMNARQRLAADVWAAQVEKITNAASLRNTDFTLEHAAPSLRTLLGRYADMGFFANPRFLELARPVISHLLRSTPGSTQRRQAALDLVTLFSREERTLETLSLSSITAEVQLTQAMYQYLSVRTINLSNANQYLDLNDFYAFYKQRANSGQLTTSQTIQGWLRAWRLPFTE
jgi:hypothetical protein